MSNWLFNSILLWKVSIDNIQDLVVLSKYSSDLVSDFLWYAFHENIPDSIKCLKNILRKYFSDTISDFLWNNVLRKLIVSHFKIMFWGNIPLLEILLVTSGNNRFNTQSTCPHDCYKGKGSDIHKKIFTIYCEFVLFNKNNLHKFVMFHENEYLEHMWYILILNKMNSQ